MKNKLITPGIVAIMALIVGFGAGYFVPHAATRGGLAGAGGQFAGRGLPGQGGQFAGRAGASGGIATGQIISAGDGSITIQSSQGSSTQIVLIGGSTQVLKTTSGSASDLSVGTGVVVQGSQNSDGSLTAQSIQIRPTGMPGFIRPGTPSQ